MHNFAGKNFLITGASRGIGLSGALTAISAGARVIATGHDRKHLKALDGLLPQDSIAVYNDAGSPDTGECLARVVETFGPLDGIWFNAGYAFLQEMDQVDSHSFDALMDVNVRGPVLQLAALSRYLVDGASVVVTSSTSAYEGAPTTDVYAATKGALVSLVRCWASTLGSRGIRVNALLPGPIQSGFRDFMAPEQRTAFEAGVLNQLVIKRIGSAQEAANVALFLLSDHSSFVTGSQYFVDGGLTMV
ncbi:Glucose 1-dehydrogenase [Halomonadaceae bacterium LMG 33818]|uniref:SDR family NAD(P)-dependent oxidoreductase n=1 Tax=Cernens ardua TaxID=3402176 RepID=UPI003EDC1AE0